jgi:phenylalanyl-tRNA synthetase beta chain
MKLVLSWLENYLALPADTSTDQISAALIQLGHEVDGVETTGAGFENVVVGHIITRVPHPNADKLGVCTVDVGEKEPRQIVCGAPNARDGITVAVALPGAILPGDFAIKKSKIRDVESNGMICSKRELALGTEHEGIWELETDAKPGTPLAQILGPGETVLDVALTPNRGDCFSHLGLARDLAALGIGHLKPLPQLTPATSKCTVTAATTTTGCPQINLLEITGITNKPSPAHIQSQLEAAGLRPKNALVDATNYVMLALGQPLHAYDFEKLNGKTLTATAAKGGETFKGLGDTTLTLASQDTIITDKSSIVGLGGILGGADSAVSDETTHIVLEAAYFDSVRIALTGQQHQLHTDARQRFERGIDPALTQYALEYCASLITEWAGGKATAMSTAGEGVKAPEPIHYHPAFFTKYIGMPVADNRQQEILEALGFTIKPIQAGWLVTPPTWRTYMSTQEDITEEVLRVVGYETVPPVLPAAMAAQFNVNGSAVTLDRTARKALAAGGFTEVITYSFIGQKDAEAFANGASLITLANPLAQTDMTTMRPSLLPGLLGALAKNLANSQPTPRLGEVGKTFTTKGEVLMAAGVLSSSAQRHWRAKEMKPDVFTAKAAAMQTLATLGAPVESGTVTATAPAHYHPGRSGTLAVGPFTLATFGELHPAIAKSLGLPGVAVFEVYLEPLLKLQSKPRPWQSSPYPAVYRDLAFLLPKTVKAADVVAAIRASNRDVLKDLQVFDHYVGERIPADKQSLALSLTLQSPDKTLTDADITPVLNAAVAAVETKLQGTLRA